MENKKEATLNFYNKYAEQYAKYISHQVLQFSQMKFISLLPKKAKILDAGCGAGRDVAAFVEEGADVIGIDFSESMLKEAKKLIPEGNFELIDMEKMSFNDNSFDGIWSLGSILHTEKGDIPKILNEFYRVLKKEGILYLAVKSGSGEATTKDKRFDNSERFFVYFTQQEIEELLRNANFEIINTQIGTDESDTEWIEIFAKKV